MTAPKKPATRKVGKPPIGPGSDDTFTFHSSGGDIELPTLANLDPTFEMLEAIASGGTQQIVLTFLHAAATPAGLEVARKLRISELDVLFKEWNEHSGISAGESSAS